jgi:hypothetical protein
MVCQAMTHDGAHRGAESGKAVRGMDGIKEKVLNFCGFKPGWSHFPSCFLLKRFTKIIN